MKKTLILFSVLVLSAVSACGGGSDDSSSNSADACTAFRVFNGQECVGDSLPTVKLVISSADGEGGCTGTIISNDDVLTAAHCVRGAHTITAHHDHGIQHATNAIANPLLVQGNAFDVGLVKFPNIAKNLGVTPARFSTRPVEVGNFIRVVGYGEDGTPSLANGNPRAVELLVREVTAGVIITFFDDSNSGTCHGDSGAAATIDGLIVATVQGGRVNQCAEGNFNSFADLQINGNVGFIKKYAPTAIFE